MATSLPPRVRRACSWAVSSSGEFFARYVTACLLRLRRLSDAVRSSNKRVPNPAVRTLERHHLYAATIRCRGRRFGKQYATPVVAAPIEDGFVIPLAFRENLDRLKNVLASGRCTLETSGATFLVGEPHVLAHAEAMAIGGSGIRFLFRVYGIERYLKVRRLPEASTARQ
jgi:hypothetical protein